MSRVVTPSVEVFAPDGTKSLWAVALPHSEAVAAVRSVIPPDHVAELSIRRLRRSPRLDGLRPGEVRKIEAMIEPKRPRDRARMAQSIYDTVKDERPDAARAMFAYRAYAVASDGRFMGFKQMICRDDSEAIASAKRLIGNLDIEVWEGDRFIMRLLHRLK